VLRDVSAARGQDDDGNNTVLWTPVTMHRVSVQEDAPCCLQDANPSLEWDEGTCALNTACMIFTGAIIAERL